MDASIVRRLRRAVVAVLAGAALPAIPAAAIDLAQSYRLALANDGQLKVARARADGGREVLPQAIAQVLPNVSYSLAYGETEQNRILNHLTEPTARYPSTNSSLTLRQPLYRQYQFAQLDQARSRVAGVDAQLDRDFQALAVRLVTAYFEALFAHDSVELIVAQKAAYEAELRAAKLGFAAGTGTRTDIDDVATKLDLLQAEEIRARQAIDSSKLQLQLFVGERVDVLATLDPGRFAADAHDPGPAPDWIDRAVACSPALRQLKASWEAAVSGIEMAKAGHLPTLDLLLQSNYSKGDANNAFPSTENRTNYVGVQLAVPIYAGGGVDSSVRQATAAAAEARESWEYARDDLRRQVQQQVDALTSGIARVHALERALASATQNVVSNRKGVLAGTRTTLDVLNVEQLRFNAQVELAKARYQVLVGWATLLSYVGDLGAEQVGRINRVLGGSG